jgi:Big-like domain-containing protein
VFLVQPNASASTLPEGQTTQLSVTADDPDGDSLGYAWTQLSPATPQGSFSSRTARNPTWVAPAVASDTPVTLQVSVNDGHGASATASFTLTVIHVQQNQPPTVSAISVPGTSPVAGDDVPLSVTATDPDGDALAFAWTQTAPATQGIWSSTTTASVVWRSPPLSSPTVTFSFQVTVSDGHNAPVYLADIQPIWDANCTSCHGSTASLDLTPSNSYLELVNQTQSADGGCIGEKLVDTGNPSASSLPKWLGGTTCGPQMPEGSQPLAPGDLVKVQSWIDNVAPNN